MEQSYHQSGYLLSLGSEDYTMIVQAYIERKAGDSFQIRITEVSSTSRRDNWTTPTYNGDELRERDIIWIKPIRDRNWKPCY